MDDAFVNTIPIGVLVVDIDSDRVRSPAAFPSLPHTLREGLRQRLLDVAVGHARAAGFVVLPVIGLVDDFVLIPLVIAWLVSRLPADLKRGFADDGRTIDVVTQRR